MTSNSGNCASQNVVTREQFEFGQVLGEGAFGQVRLCKHKTTDVQYAAKILRKEALIKKNQTKYAKTEREILLMVNHPNVVKLFFTFADDKRLYFITELISGGELFLRVQRKKKVISDVIKFYMAELLEAISYIHSKDIVHRDLKPENLLLSGDGHLKVIDFGIAKNIEFDGMHTFCGTAEYLAPEIISNNSYGKGVDWWAYGCIIYELFCGKSPFVSTSMPVTCQKILERDIYWSPELPDDAKDLIDKLLTVDINKRLGCGSPKSSNSPNNIYKHKFFEGINFGELRNATPPIVPDDLGFDGPIGFGVNMSIYSIHNTYHNADDEKVLFACKVFPMSFYNNSSEYSFGRGSLDDVIRRSHIIRQMYPELKKLPLRPKPILSRFIEAGADKNLKCIESDRHSLTGKQKETMPTGKKSNSTLTYMQTVVDIGTPVKRLTWSINDQKLSVAGSFCVRSYGVNATSEASLHMELLKAEKSGSSSSYLKFSSNGQYLAYDLQRQIGIVRQKEEKRNGIQWSNALYISSVLIGHSQPIRNVCWSPSNYILAASGLSGAIYIWDVRRTKFSQKFEAHLSPVNTLDWRQESTSNAESVSLLASGGQDGRVVVYDINSSKILSSMSSPCEILGVSWSPTQSNILVSYGTDRTLAFTSINDWKQIKVFGNTNPILGAQWSSNGKYLAAVDNEAIRIWDIAMMKVLKTITRDNTNWNKSNTNTILGGKAPIISDISTALAAFDYSSRYLACTTCNYDRIPAIFDISSDNFLEKQAIVSHRAPITCMEWSSTRPVLATGSYDHTIMLWGVDIEN